MCEQCTTAALHFGEPLPGWFLMRARRDGNHWKKGEWGMVESNDPNFRWTTTPTPDPLFRIDDDEEQAAWFKANPKGTPGYERTMAYPPEDLKQALRMGPASGYRLVAAAIKKGYVVDESGDFDAWLFAYLGEWLVDAPMTAEADPFPELEATNPIDPSIGRD